MSSLKHFMWFLLLLLPFLGVMTEEEESWLTSALSSTWQWTKTVGCSALGYECCMPPFVRTEEAVSILDDSLHKSFFGQHIATKIVLNSLKMHLRDPKPGKALAFSFHGWAGSGKTYLTKLIAEALFKEGVNSAFYKVYMSSKDFPDHDSRSVQQYQKLLRYEITKILSRCPYSVIVFDEVDKAPPRLLDSLVSFIDHPSGTVDGVQNHKKAIFIFLSNAGSNVIHDVVLNSWRKGEKRENLTFVDFHDKLSKQVFNNEESGLHKSRVISKILMDYYVPFLPLEKSHVRQCIRAEEKRQKIKVNTEEIISQLQYWPPEEGVFSSTGCKRIEALVKYNYADNNKNKSWKDDDNDEEHRGEL